MKRRFKNREEAIEALRKEPALRALVEDLKAQTPDQIDRLNDYLVEGGRDDEEDSRADSEGNESETP